MNGFWYTPADTTGHVAIPAAGSFTKEHVDGPARLLHDEDYPVIAACKVCHGRVKLDYKLQLDWRHAP